VLRFTSPVSHKRREFGLGLVSRQSLQHQRAIEPLGTVHGPLSRFARQQRVATGSLPIRYRFASIVPGRQREARFSFKRCMAP